jgi:hypothetical protein
MDVRIKVYSGSEHPEILLADQKFNYSFPYYSGGSYLSGNRDMNTTVENYIRFVSPIQSPVNFLFLIAMPTERRRDFVY